MSKRTRSWSVQAEARVPEGPETLSALAWDLARHGLESPIWWPVHVYARLRRRRPQEHYLYSGGLRPGAPIWAPVPQEFPTALVRALKEVGILGRNCQISGLNIESTWELDRSEPDWEEPGYSIRIVPADEAAEHRTTCRYERRLIATEVEGRPEFRQIALSRWREPWAIPPLDPSRWLSRLLWVMRPYGSYGTGGYQPRPLSIRIRVIRQPAVRQPDILRLLEAVLWSLDRIQIIGTHRSAVSEVAVRAEPGPEPRTQIEVWRLPEFGRQIWVA